MSLEETLRRHDAKVRLAAGVVAERFGWWPVRVGRLMVLPDGTTPRRQVGRHDAVLRTAYPLRGPALRAWLRAPVGSVAGLAFLPSTNDGRTTGRVTSRRRVARPKSSPAQAGMVTAGATEDAPFSSHDPGSSSVQASSVVHADNETRS